mmetsp:Transcript_30564/g.75871  ORF Transcript_30564/g.75871 Transcript_30564/m.75871 type:complete len:212 (-) Transcript_30564:535-1170(-)
MSGSIRPYSCVRAVIDVRTLASTASLDDGRTAITADASRAIAFLLSPPPMSTALTPCMLIKGARTLASSLTALPRSSWMLMPECPPFSPAIRKVLICQSPCSLSSVTGMTIRVSPPPAQPTVTSPHDSESRFSMYLPVRMAGSKSRAPFKPVSSSTVKRHSRGGSLASAGAARRANAMAHPTPLSAPSVVPSAPSQSSLLLTSLIGSLKKS